MAPTPRLIKKYPNRRLYDTQTSAYITLADIRQLVLDGEDFRVQDARSQADLTRSILLQIIQDAETSGSPLFSQHMLTQLIRFHGHSMQGIMSSYLEQSLQTFVEVQDRMQAQSRSLYDGQGIPSAELWAQFLQAQAPMMQSMMGTYIEQSKHLFFQMQAQMQQQARSMLGGFPASLQPPAPQHMPDGAAGTTAPASAAAPVPPAGTEAEGMATTQAAAGGVGDTRHTHAQTETGGTNAPRPAGTRTEGGGSHHASVRTETGGTEGAADAAPGSIRVPPGAPRGSGPQR